VRRPGEASLISVANVLPAWQIITSETITALVPMAVACIMLTVPAVVPMLVKMKAVLARSS
jgi:hypothetical protein